jgi:predicted small lipoprotein YifL
MRIMRIARSSLAVVLMLYGCGYKGPLYLPESKPAAKRPAPAASVQPAETKPADGAAKQ